MTLPETITLDYQPYGCVTLGNLRFGDYRGHPTLIGTVLSGKEYGFLFGRSAGRDVTGETREVYGITAAELQRGHIVRIAARWKSRLLVSCNDAGKPAKCWTTLA